MVSVREWNRGVHDNEIVLGIFKTEVQTPHPDLPKISTHSYDLVVGTHAALRNMALTPKCPTIVDERPINGLPPQVRFKAFSKYYKELYGINHPRELDHDSLDELHDYYSEKGGEDVAEKARHHLSPLTFFSYTVFGHGGKVIACSHTASKRSGASKFKDVDTSLEHLCAKDLASKVTHFCTEAGGKKYLSNQPHADFAAADLYGLLFKRAKPDEIRDTHLVGHNIDPHDLVEKNAWLSGLEGDFRASRVNRKR